MRGFIGYFIKYDKAGWVVKALIVLFGIICMFALRASLFPLSPSRQILVEAVYPGASPEEIEEGIITKVEDNLKGITGIEKVSSVSQENRGTITVELFKGYSESKALEDVKNAVDQINSFPLGMEPIKVYNVEPRTPAISFAITGDVDLKTLKTFGRRVEDDLRSTSGISKVTLSGFPDEEIEVSLNENALRGYNLTFAQVMGAISKENIELTGGTIKTPEEELLVRARNKGYYADDLKDIYLITTPDGRIVRLRDVATVVDRWADVPSNNFVNGNPSVLVTVEHTNEENILDINAAVYNYIEQFNANNNIVKATIINDSSVSLRQRIMMLAENGALGFILVVIILSMFLNWRVAVWVALAIPVSFCGMFVLAYLYGITINVMSLFGMILVTGILVDDGIVIAENVYQHFERGKTPLRAAVDGTLEVLPAVTSAVLTTIIAFSTFFFLEGRLGDFATQLAFVVGATLLVSLIEGAIILPAHLAHSKALQANTKPNLLERNTTRFMTWLKDRIYGPSLTYLTKNIFIGVAIFVALLAITFGGMAGGIIKTTFFPNVERNEINVILELPSGSREEQTDSILRMIETVAWRMNDSISPEMGKTFEIENYSLIEKIERKLGPATHMGQLTLILVDAESRSLKANDITKILRQMVGPVNGVEKLAYEQRSPFGKPVSVSLVANDLKELTTATEDLRNELNSLSTVRDVTSTDQPGMREINLKLKDKAYLLGLDLQTVLSQVRAGFFGGEIQRLQRGIDEVKVWVRYEEDYRSSLGSLEDMRIRTADGNEYPLREIAEYSIERGVIGINHLNGKRVIRLEGEVADPALSVTDIMAEVQGSIVPKVLSKYPNVRATYEGQAEQSKKTSGSVGKVFPIIFLLMLATIALTFRSIMQSIIVVLMVPFGFIGVAWGHWLHGIPVSLLSFYGLIALLGIMVNDSLVLVSAMNGYLKEGMAFKDALMEASKSRLRPILLTSLTTIAGLGPIILETSFQAQFLIPMAVTIAYGLLVATFVTLYLLPLALMMLNTLRLGGRWLATGEKAERSMVEPAVIEMKYEKEDI